MSGQRRFLKTWARTVGMPIGINDEDKPELVDGDTETGVYYDPGTFA